MAEFDLGYRGTKAIVTGAASGMGEAVARILGELGAEVHTVDLNEPSTSSHGFYRTDLSEPEQVSAAAAALREKGPFAHYFSCAGVPHTFGALKCMLVNYVGARQLIEEVLPALTDRSGIGIIASEAGIGWKHNLATNLELLAVSDPAAARRWCEERPEAIRDGYTVSKEMLIVWAMHSCIALGGDRGIRINCTAPSPTGTAFMDQTVEAVGREYFEAYPYPLFGRMTTAEEQAWPLVLLNSPLNAAVTGAILYTDQGFAGGMLTGSLDASKFMPTAAID